MGEIIKYVKDNRFRLMMTSIVFCLFYYISYKTPLSGDDWAFHNNVVKSNVVDAAIGMYFHWEGRLMTLFSMHTLIQYKEIWNLLNAFIFANTFYLLSSFIKKENQKLSLLFLFFFIVSIKDNIRMETYTWITGSIYYGIPLWLSIVLLFTITNSLFKGKENWISYILVAFTSFYLPLGMENISIAIGFVVLSLIVYDFYKQKKVHPILIVSIIFYGIAFVIWYLSPGSNIRLATMPEWQTLSIFEKVLRNLPQIINYVFIQNKVIIFSLSCLLIYVSYKTFSKIEFVMSILVYGIAIIYLLNTRLIQYLPQTARLFDVTQWWSMLFWVLYIVLLLSQIIRLNIYKLKQPYLIIFMGIASLSSASLLMSPVIGSRLILYAVFYMFISFVLILEIIEINRLIKNGMIVILIVMSFIDVRTFYIKYNAVANIYHEREMILDDYHLYSDQYTTGIWLPRYPIYTIHAGDIEEEDSYHMEAFKIYNNIPMDTDVIFYWKESY